MAELSRLKRFMLCTFIVAVASFVVMFYYSVSFPKYTNTGVNNVTAITYGNLGKDLHEQTLLSNDSSGASEEGNVNVVNSFEPSVRSQPTEENSIIPEDIATLQSTSNSSKRGSTERLSTEAVKPTTSTTTQPILAAPKTQSNITQKFCPEKSSSLGESFFI